MDHQKSHQTNPMAQRDPIDAPLTPWDPVGLPLDPLRPCRPTLDPPTHSGLGGGGLGHFGVNFFYCFFGVLWPSYMHMGWGKCNLPSGKASKGSKSKPILGLDHRFPLYFAILHKVSSVL